MILCWAWGTSVTRQPTRIPMNALIAAISTKANCQPIKGPNCHCAMEVAKAVEAVWPRVPAVKSSLGKLKGAGTSKRRVQVLYVATWRLYLTSELTKIIQSYSIKKLLRPKAPVPMHRSIPKARPLPLAPVLSATKLKSNGCTMPRPMPLAARKTIIHLASGGFYDSNSTVM